MKRKILKNNDNVAVAQLGERRVRNDKDNLIKSINYSGRSPKKVLLDGLAGLFSMISAGENHG